jgi:cytochrome c biogenesis protein
LRQVWDFLNSLKLTVYLILAIVAVTMYGSMVLYVHQEIFGDMDGDLLFHWLSTKGPQSLEYTWWLYVLVLMVVLLGLNTMVCTVERLPKIIKRYRDPLLNLRDIELGGGEGRAVAFDGGAHQALAGFLGRRRYKVFTEGDALYAEKNRWLPFMPYVIHAGIMLFMVGHLISSMYGYRHSGLYIFEGETAKSPAGDYAIRLDKFKLDTRPDGSLKQYGSSLTIIKDGQEIKTGTVTANKPMFVEGGAVYQREFGQDMRGVWIKAGVKSTGFNDYVLLPKGTGYADIPGTSYRVKIDNFIPDFALDQNGEPYSLSEELANPAMTVTLYKGGSVKRQGWLHMRDEDSGFKDDDVGLAMADLDMKTYSSFDINRDPSAITALIASVTVMFVTVLTLYFRRERVWARVDKDGTRAQVVCTDDELYEEMQILSPRVEVKLSPRA